MPFDRLVQAVDAWAQARGRGDVFAQVGLEGWQPRHIAWTPFLSPAEFREKVEQASLLIAHAGMGSILTALEVGRPILVMPRRGDLRETRNDHQVATARHFAAQGTIAVAMDETEIPQRLDEFVARAAGSAAARGPLATDSGSEQPQSVPPPRISPYASPQLLAAVRAFIHSPSGASVRGASVPLAETPPRLVRLNPPQEAPEHDPV